MWRGHEDFTAVCNAYQFRIKIITVRGADDQNPIISIIEPNPDFLQCSEVPVGKVPDMVIFHEDESHYSLIIPDDSRLAVEGGLDYQRIEQKKQIVQEENYDVLLSKSQEEYSRDCGWPRRP